mgnify:CR=1 FL=1
MTQKECEKALTDAELDALAAKCMGTTWPSAYVNDDDGRIFLFQPASDLRHAFEIQAKAMEKDAGQYLWELKSVVSADAEDRFRALRRRHGHGLFDYGDAMALECIKATARQRTIAACAVMEATQ